MLTSFNSCLLHLQDSLVEQVFWIAVVTSRFFSRIR